MKRRYGCYYTSCFHLLLGDELMLQLGLPQEITQLDMHNFQYCSVNLLLRPCDSFEDFLKIILQLIHLIY